MSRKIIDSILKLPYTIFYAFVHAFLAVVKPVKIACMRTYYPEKKRKPIIERYFDCLRWRVKNKDSNCFYTLYGLDCYGADEKKYVPETSFWRQLTKMNGLLLGNEYCYAGSQVYHLRDKLAFFVFMQSHKLPVPKVRYLIKDGKYYDLNMNEVRIEEITGYQDFFVKDLNGQCASFVKHIDVAKDLKNYSNLEKGLYILQDAVHQSDEMNHINPGSINTLRIVTINKDGHPYVFSSILRVGTAKTVMLITGL